MVARLGWSLAGWVAALAVFVVAALAAGGAGAARSDSSNDFDAHLLRGTALLRLAEAEQGTAVARTVALAQAATRTQVQALGLLWAGPPPPTTDTAPVDALAALGNLYGVQLASGEAVALDTLAEPLRGALTRLVGAFLAFDGATRAASAPADAAPILAARNALLDAALDLATLGDPRPAVAISLCPAVALDLAGTDSTYTADCALVVDVGGNDTYLNNAGGGRFPLAAALVDLGVGSDRYGDELKPRGGVNGGAAAGVVLATAGFLFDGGGSDRYVGSAGGVNGGAEGGGLGQLVDVGGDDAYAGGHSGVNGGGSLFGVGLLVDGGGTDTYTADFSGVNGGGFAGKGALVDVGGSDVYSGRGLGVNGGGYAGSGLLVDAAGADSYTATFPAVNGGANTGVGLLLDGGGRDTYSDQDQVELLGPRPCPGEGIDRTVVPKCEVGAQVDVARRGGG